jgi:hypothetical protein
MRTPRLTAGWSLGPAIGTYVQGATWAVPAGAGALEPMQPNPCAGVGSGTIGICFDANGPLSNRLNCSACCALRGAVGWVDNTTVPPTVVVC